jgi:hypothetical protein
MMTIKKWLALLWLGLAMSFSTIPANAGSSLGQSIQINTRFHSVIGNPVWLLILRNADTGVVMPYLYDVRNNDNFWIAFSYGRNYIITASTLKFGPFAVIHNFCHLENGVLSGKSMIITLTGDLTPSPRTSKCRILKYNDYPFPMATTP